MSLWPLYILSPLYANVIDNVNFSDASLSGNDVTRQVQFFFEASLRVDLYEFVEKAATFNIRDHQFRGWARWETKVL